MKKQYIAPRMQWERLATMERLMAVSSEDLGIGYGGVDEDGTMDPSVRRRCEEGLYDNANGWKDGLW